MTVVGLVVTAVNMAVDPTFVPRSVPLSAVPIAVLLAAGARITARLLRRRGTGPDRRQAQRVIIFGAGSEGEQLLRSMFTDPLANLRPVALLDDNPQLRRRRISGVSVHGTRADIASVASRSRADLLVIPGDVTDGTTIREISEAAFQAGLNVRMARPLSELLQPLPPGLTTPPPGAGPITLVRRFEPAPAVLSRGKRAFDIALCSVSLLIVLPLFLLIAVVLKVTTGQVLYRAKRVGRDGQMFTMFKFATMVPGDSGPRVTRASDPRITRVGRWLRDTKLNELPQIFNVLKGDMSLVGPRPEDPRYAAFYSERQRRVLAVRPGMTSLSFLKFGDEQAYIERAAPSDIENYYLTQLLPQKLEIELEYVSNWSMAGDLRILARTFIELVS
jgi:lipopolysaccharide/colanic/teichoic acid biosynthesis glycosyltransferase